MSDCHLYFVHVGLHKTGTTWLQEDVWNKHPQLDVVGLDKSSALHYHIHRLYADEPGIWNCDSWVHKFQALTTSKGTSKRLGISAEILSGNMFTGQLSLLVAERLVEAFGQFKVVIVVRHPLHYLRSMYCQYIKQGGSLPLKSLLDDPNIPGKLIYRRLDYKFMIDEYTKRIGRENIVVLPFEWLRQDSEAFLKKISEFLEIENWPEGTSLRSEVRNQSLTNIGCEIMRLANYLGVSRHRSRRLIQKMDSRVLAHLFPTKAVPKIEMLLQYKGFAEVLQSSRYEFWTDELERFNYTF